MTLTGDIGRALLRTAEQLVETEPVQAALTQASAGRERLIHFQEATLGAMNLPTAAESERVTRRVRSVAQRIDGIEDALDRIEQQLGDLAGSRLSAAPKQD